MVAVMQAWRAGAGGLAITAAVLVTAEVSGQGQLELEWIAPADCPTRADVLQTIDSLLGRSTSVALEAPLTVRAKITESKQTYTVELWWRASGVEQTRWLQAVSCSELARAAALVVAFAIDPGGEKLGAPAPETPTAPPPGEQSPRGAEPAAVDRAPQSQPVPVPRVPLRLEEPWRQPAAAKVVGTRDEQQRWGNEEWLWLGRAQAALDIGSLPSPGVGGTVGAAARKGSLLAALDLSLFFPQEASVDEDEGGGRFWLAGASLKPCYVVELSWATLRPCAMVELALIASNGQGLDSPDRRLAWFPRVGAGAEVGYPLTSKLGVIGGVWALVAPARPTFVVDGGVTVHEPDFISALCTAGVEFGPF